MALVPPFPLYVPLPLPTLILAFLFLLQISFLICQCSAWKPFQFCGQQKGKGGCPVIFWWYRTEVFCIIGWVWWCSFYWAHWAWVLRLPPADHLGSNGCLQPALFWTLSISYHNLSTISTPLLFLLVSLFLYLSLLKGYPLSKAGSTFFLCLLWKTNQIRTNPITLGHL